MTGWKDFVEKLGPAHKAITYHLFNDVSPDVVYDIERNKLKPLSTLGWFVAYQHQWSRQFYSLATYAELEQDNENVQLPTAIHKT